MRLVRAVTMIGYRLFMVATSPFVLLLKLVRMMIGALLCCYHQPFQMSHKIFLNYSDDVGRACVSILLINHVIFVLTVKRIAKVAFHTLPSIVSA